MSRDEKIRDALTALGGIAEQFRLSIENLQSDGVSSDDLQRYANQQCSPISPELSCLLALFGGDRVLLRNYIDAPKNVYGERLIPHYQSGDIGYVPYHLGESANICQKISSDSRPYNPAKSEPSGYAYLIHHLPSSLPLVHIAHCLREIIRLTGGGHPDEVMYVYQSMKNGTAKVHFSKEQDADQWNSIKLLFDIRGAWFAKNEAGRLTLAGCIESLKTSNRQNSCLPSRAMLFERGANSLQTAPSVSETVRTVSPVRASGLFLAAVASQVVTANNTPPIPGQV